MSWADILTYQAIYAFIGVFAGLMAGVLGIGGGMIVVPALVFVFQLSHLIPNALAMHVAAGTSLAVMIITSQASLRAHAKLGGILWSVFDKLWPGLILGTICGAILAQVIPTHWLEIIFAVFLLGVAAKMLNDGQAIHPEHFPANWLNHLTSLLIGVLSGLLGIGGGTLITPYLTYCGVAVRKIVPISNLGTLVVSIVGTIAFMITGQKDMAAVAHATGYVYWPAVLGIAITSYLVAPLGARLSYMLPVKQLSYVFIVILILTAIKMLF